jgi:hypothetical protein
MTHHATNSWCGSSRAPMYQALGLVPGMPMQLVSGLQCVVPSPGAILISLTQQVKTPVRATGFYDALRVTVSGAFSLVTW